MLFNLGKSTNAANRIKEINRKLFFYYSILFATTIFSIIVGCISFFVMNAPVTDTNKFPVLSGMCVFLFAILVAFSGSYYRIIYVKLLIREKRFLCKKN